MGEAGVAVTPEVVWERLRKDWLMVGDVGAWGHREIGADWFALVAERREQLARYVRESEAASTSDLIVMIADAEPVNFLAGLWAALLSGWSLALANAQWGHQEWLDAQNLIQPQIIWHAPRPHKPTPLRPYAPTFPRPHPPTHSLTPAILIPTGGSSGQLKFAHHTWQTLRTSVAGFHQHFLPAQTPITAYCVLPLYHVSGLLQALRTALTGGQLFLTAFKTLRHLPVSRRPRPFSFISLVPTQLSRLLQTDKAPWLAHFHAVLLGGAPSWPSLIERAIAHKVPLCLSYGMTETAAMVSSTRSNDFLEAQDSSVLGSGRAMPHATLKIERAGQSLPVGEVGQVVLCSEAIALGYYKAPSPDFAPNTFYTDDIGHLEADGTLHITGRASGKIISGGENIFPAEVEAALHKTGQVCDVCVMGVPHPIWGEAVSAAYVPKDSTVSPESLKAALVKESVQVSGKTMTPALSRYKVPKHWFPLPHLPRNEQGKINRSALSAQLKTLSNLSAQTSAADGGESRH